MDSRLTNRCYRYFGTQCH